MHIVIAPDKFKGSLSAPEVAEIVERGLLSVDPTLTVERIPVADGGEGTLDAAVGSGYELRTARVSGPTGEPVDAAYAILGTSAVVELATASGLAVLAGGTLEPLLASSRGTGELIAAALDGGCSTIVLGVGGSACTDGGAGMLAGLGARLLDERGEVLRDGGGSLLMLSAVDLSGLDARLDSATIVLASDVDNPLLGSEGAAAIFAPQKGATDENVEVLEAGLARFARILQSSHTLSAEARERASAAVTAPGAGAAGGVGFAALAALGARRKPGVDVVLEFTGVPERLKCADLVITGEGSLDGQSLGGKTPVGVAQAAARAGVPTVAVCGRTSLSQDQVAAAGFVRSYALTDLEPDVDKCIRDAAMLLEQLGARIGGDLGRLVEPGAKQKEEHDG